MLQKAEETLEQNGIHMRRPVDAAASTASRRSRSPRQERRAVASRVVTGSREEDEDNDGRRHSRGNDSDSDDDDDDGDGNGELDEKRESRKASSTVKPMDEDDD